MPPAEDSLLRAPPSDDRIVERVDRFEVLELLGVGGMGRVHLAWDPRVGRRVALKRLKEQPPGTESIEQRSDRRARFLAEARLTAQLDHPNILPVYEIGRERTDDPYYVMKLVRDFALADVLAALRRDQPEFRERWDLRRLLGVFTAACHGMAYAHEHGVVHRDLKPANVMLDRHDQVFVMDWGVAGLMGAADGRAGPESFPTVQTLETMAGALVGTPGWMSPEQLELRAEQLDARSDVYSLGLILFELLTGTSAFESTDPRVLMVAPLMQEVPDPRARAPQREIPDELAELCIRALKQDREERLESADRLAAGVEDWSAGRQRAIRADAYVLAAQVDRDRRNELLAERDRRQETARALLAIVPSWATEEEKAAAWSMEAEAEESGRRARLHDVRAEQNLLAAIGEVPEHTEAHRLLALRYRKLHADAEQGRDAGEVAVWEERLRAHDRGEHAAYLKGTGRLTLVTEPPATSVRLSRYVERNRRLVPVFDRELGPAPLTEVELEPGSWLLELDAPDRATVRYPVAIGRQEHWDGRPLGADEAVPVPLPKVEDLGPDDLYVPPGWFIAGQDGLGHLADPKHRVFLDGFVIRRFPVTNREYIEFLDDLVAQGRGAEADEFVPSVREANGRGEAVYGKDDAGRFHLAPDPDGDLWEPDWPVVMIDWHSAAAYAAWLADREGKRWRLPRELEWEKAARGVDGRAAPWGELADPARANIRGSLAGGGTLVPVDSFPGDVSVYGVRGTAGNVREMVRDGWQARGPTLGPDGRPSHPSPDSHRQRVKKGGCWFTMPRFVRSALRSEIDLHRSWDSAGFRLARDPAEVTER